MKDTGLFILRVGIGLLMVSHGWAKLQYLLGGDIHFPDPLGLGEIPSLVLAVFAEFFCSLMLILGIKTRWATIPLIITMIIAAFVVHWSDPWGKKELAVLYLIPLISIALSGPGKYSIDRR
ncbi:MAG: DoxX family protein [Vicingaceae bacterium]